MLYHSHFEASLSLKYTMNASLINPNIYIELYSSLNIYEFLNVTIIDIIKINIKITKLSI